MRSLRGYIDVVLSAVFSSAGSLVVVTAALWLEPSLSSALVTLVVAVGAVVVYSPCGLFSLTALDYLGTATMLFLFGLLTSITDVLAEVVVRGTSINEPLPFVAGIFFALLVLIALYEPIDGEVAAPDRLRANELLLYLVAAVVLCLGFAWPVWYVGVVGYGLSEYGGALLGRRIAFAIASGRRPNLRQKFVGATIGFIPAVVASVVVLVDLDNIAIGGLIITLVAAFMPYLIEGALFGGKLGWKVWFAIVVAVLSGTCLFISF